MSQQDCLFCKIVGGDLSADIVYENESLIAFRDINPLAPTHILLIPRRHIATMNDLQDGDAAKGRDNAAGVSACEQAYQQQRRAVRRCGRRGVGGGRGGVHRAIVPAAGTAQCTYNRAHALLDHPALLRWQPGERLSQLLGRPNSRSYMSDILNGKQVSAVFVERFIRL